MNLNVHHWAIFNGLKVSQRTEFREIHSQSVLVPYQNKKEISRNMLYITIEQEEIVLKRYIDQSYPERSLVMGYGERTDVLVYFWENNCEQP